MKRKLVVLLPAVVLAVAITPDFSIAQDTGYAVTERGLNYAVHQKTVVEHGTNRVHQYTELATGLNYTNNYRQLVESKEEIDVLPNGTAAATQGRHKAYFPGDIYTGNIEVVTPDGLHLKSRPLAISYDDGTNTVLIGVLTNSAGVLAASNQVVYPNAFAGLNADLRYTYRKGGFEQDVVLNEQPPAPESFGLNSQYTHLQVLTEFFNPPEPKQVRAKASAKAGLTDTTLTFGQMKMVQGKAFSIPHPASGHPLPSDGRGKGEGKVSVSKSWVHLQGRTFLIEELPVSAVAAQLQQLPAPASASVSSVEPAARNRRTAPTLQRELPPVRPVQDNAVQLVKADIRYKSGVVLDYDEIDGGLTDFTFEGGETYYISEGVGLDGTTTIQGGAVVKFNPDVYMGIMIGSDGSVNCQTGPYNPAIFTSQNDDTVGEVIEGSTGTPVMDTDIDFFIEYQGQISLHDLRFSYCYESINLEGVGSDDTATVSDVQFDNVWNAILSYPCDVAPVFNLWNLSMQNMGDTAVCMEDTSVYPPVFNITHMTLNQGYGLVDDDECAAPFDPQQCTLFVTNSIMANLSCLADVPSTMMVYGDHNGFYNCPTFGTTQITDGSNPFQTVDGGSCYVSFEVDGLPGGVGMTNQWIFGGNFYNNESNAIPGSSDCSTVPYVDSTLLTNNPTTAWWVSGGAPIVYLATVNYTFFFYNGQAPLTISANGLFNMWKPGVGISVDASHSGTVAVDGNYYIDPNYFFGVHFGENQALDYGIKFGRILVLPPKPSGIGDDMDWVQVINSTRSLTNGISKLSSDPVENVLDTSDPYLGNDDYVYDSPATLGNETTDSSLMREFDANMFLMYTPSGGHRVPLAKVHWSWSGTGTRSGTTWSLTDSSKSIGGPESTEDYPLWTNNISNFLPH